MNEKANKGILGFMSKNKYYSFRVPNGVTLNNENTLVAKEELKQKIVLELKNLETCGDVVSQLAKIASLTSLYIDLDKGGCGDIPFILVNKNTGHISITKELPDDIWVEALEASVKCKNDKQTN